MAAPQFIGFALETTNQSILTKVNSLDTTVTALQTKLDTVDTNVTGLGTQLTEISTTVNNIEASTSNNYLTNGTELWEFAVDADGNPGVQFVKNVEAEPGV